MREDHGLSWSHEKVVERFFQPLHKVMIRSSKRFQFDGILDEFIHRFDPERFGESSVTLPLGTLGDTLQLDLFLGDGVTSAGTTRRALLKMTTGT
jgi:hypothetical protein